MNPLLLIDENRRSLRRARVFRDRMDPFHVNETELLKHYRFTKEAILEITELLDVCEPKTKRSQSIPALYQCCIALNYYATGALYSSIQSKFGVSRASVSRIVHRVSKVLSLNLHRFVKFPNEEHIDETVLSFHNLAGFPNVIGCVDGCQVAIKKPSRNEHIYVCRKGYHSINVQVACDAHKRFVSISVKYPGHAHDSFVFKNSNLRRRLENLSRTQWILGDSGYPNRRYLLTPLLHPRTRAEKSYNTSHMKTRVVVECLNGIWKSRFLCLSHKVTGPLPFTPQRCVQVIAATAVLHNIALSHRLPNPEYDVENDIEEIEEATLTETDGFRVREKLINEYFTV